MADATTTILGGKIVQSTSPERTIGMRSAVLVRDGSPQQVIPWFEDQPRAADCAAFVDAITDEEVANGGFVPVEEGQILLPANPGG
jgi:hypothetical protein